jgi:hypothetical protein
LLVNDVRAESDELLENLRATLTKNLRVDTLRDIEVLHAATTREAATLAAKHRATLCGVVSDVTRRESATDINHRAGIELVEALRNDRIDVPICLYYASATFHPRDVAEFGRGGNGGSGCTLTTREADAVDWILRLLD